ncbi:DUF3592 domain-containing protein [Granulicella cerasi]|uniref:DUF3592 domain-containing protein n=1 Tax=Granulicella cerasi TaxID=741063 RepID=A0ABW1Z7H6_9BACT|nr:DUF3592 domain-containing protein [Granulicella cerasi]
MPSYVSPLVVSRARRAALPVPTGRFPHALKLALLWTGIILMTIAVGLALHTWWIDRPLVRATGTVEMNDTLTSGDGDLVYVAHVRFRDEHDAIREFTLSPKGEETKYHPSMQFPLLYPHGHPEQARIATVWREYATARNVAILGVVLFDIGCIFWIRDRRRDMARLARQQR